MKLTNLQRHQLRKTVDGLADYSLDVLSDEAMHDLLGSGFVGYYEQGIAASMSAREDGYGTKANRKVWPPEVGHYHDVRLLAERNARTLPARIETQRRNIEAARARISGMEQAHASQVASAWKRYRELHAEAPWWFAAGHGDPELPPPVLDASNPPYEAKMCGEMSPRRRGQIEALKRLLETSAEETGN